MLRRPYGAVNDGRNLRALKANAVVRLTRWVTGLLNSRRASISPPSTVTIRTRFAPSPTGYLHIGGARTALFSWLYARHHQGVFVLRIEDTDLERSTPEAVQAILDGMAWLKLDYDEGPIYQTQRFDRYQEVIAKLISEGKAYPCFCSKERLEQLRREQMARREKPRYDGHCRDGQELASDGRAYVVRFKNPLDGEVIVDDQIRGSVIFQNRELDDLIIARSDGSPTYNFTVVVDDWDMRISHVIRGDDHLNNTPRQINIFEALGATPPKYAHVPMILGPDGAKLSKRHGAVSVLQYRDDGFLPEALLNYLVRLGWSHGDQEVFSITEMVDKFDVDAVNKSAAAINPDKLAWLNQHYLKTLEPEYVGEHLSRCMDRLGIRHDEGPDLAQLVLAQRERAKTLVEMAQNSRFFFEDFESYEASAAAKHLKPDSLEPLRALKDALAGLERWNKEALHKVIASAAETFGLGLGKIAQPLRVALTGGAVSPPIDITLELLGRDKALARIDRALDFVAADT